MDSIGERLREIRLKQKLKMKDVAESAGIAQSTLSYIEKGTNSPSVDNLTSILKVYGITMAEFFTEDKPGEPAALSPADQAMVEKIKDLPEHERQAVETIIKTLSSVKNEKAAAGK